MGDKNIFTFHENLDVRYYHEKVIKFSLKFEYFESKLLNVPSDYILFGKLATPMLLHTIDKTLTRCFIENENVKAPLTMVGTQRV